MITQGLPVEDVVDELKTHLLNRDEVVLQAPPGAGKTTLIPLVLLNEPWLNNKKILMLEPRRLATRAAAYRMAYLLGESTGETVGYRMRLDTNVGKNTRIEVITEGIMTRMLQHDPSLEEVGLVIFDEFHERNLDSDLALSLCLKGRSIFREERSADHLKILVMSATLDSQKVASLLDDAPIVTSQGKQFPVEVIFGQASQPNERIVDRMITSLKKVIRKNSESGILAFLPGQGEIRRTADELSNWISDSGITDVDLFPLYGHLSFEEQQLAIAPAVSKTKIVLATNIAETSLTIDGIDVVIDSGLAREPVFDPATGMTRLHTRKISRASSDQRAGRAGRLKAGKCYRLWSKDQQQQLIAHTTPEILQADLTPLVLQLLKWGVDDPEDMRWLDPPPRGPWQQAVELLVSLAAVSVQMEAENIPNDNLSLTDHGQAMSELPVHPRLAHLMICGARISHGRTAALLAGILSERDPIGQDNPDIDYRMAILTGEADCPRRHKNWQRRILQLAQQFEEQLSRLAISTANTAIDENIIPGYLLACAYPDRIARRRHSGGYQLTNGRSANLANKAQPGKHPWLAVAEVGGMARSKGNTIRSAAALDPDLFQSLLSDLVSETTVADWDKKTRRFIAEHQQKIGELVLNRETLTNVPSQAKSTALVQHIRKQGLEILPWTKTLRQWQARILLLRSIDPNTWPDVSDDALLSTLSSWLAPYLDPINLLNDFKKLNLKTILGSMLTWDSGRELNRLAPERIEVPSGSTHAIDYSHSPPVLAVKLQEMFGCEESPTIADGNIKLMVHLLSPAGRPLQITQDLAGFWRSSYHDVRKDMKGRYPKHPWPEDPLTAVATSKTKGRS